MRPARPKLHHPPETYAAILRAHHEDPIRLADTLIDLGWSLGAAAHAAMHWPPLWLAAAIANTRAARDAPPPPPPPRKTTRVIRRSPPRSKPPP